MSDHTLFPLTPRAGQPADAAGAPRYETANRTQVELYPCDLEALLPEGHAARLVWRFVEGLDLAAFYATIKAREGGVGRTPIDPKILIALWLYATIDGVGSARELDRLCGHHDAYRWIRGGVSVNYHTLSDFRVAQHDALDALLTQSIAALLQRGIVTLARVAQDGTRVRASAGAGSFRRGAHLARLSAHRAETGRADAAASRRALDGDRRRAGPRGGRPARARRRSVGDLARGRSRQSEAGEEGEERAARVDDRSGRARDEDGRRRLPPGLQRPVRHRCRGPRDRRRAGQQRRQRRGLLAPMVAEIERRTGRGLATYLVDGGFVNHAAIQAAAARGIAVYAPPETPKTDRAAGAPARHDTPAIAAWRARMATADAKQIRTLRGATAEWVNADARAHRTLDRIPVRGLPKVHTWALWIALAHNLLRLTDLVPHLMT